MTDLAATRIGRLNTERDGRVLTVKFDNPPRNLMTFSMLADLHELVCDLEDDTSVGAIVFTGEGDAFPTHIDVGQMLDAEDDMGKPVSARVAGAALRAVGAAMRVPGLRRQIARTPAAPIQELTRQHEILLRMQALDKVCIAAINGAALAGGCEFSLACDIRIMADDPTHRIGNPELMIGVIPGWGGTQRLVRTLGPSRALEMMLEARVLAPREALEVGLVHRLADPDELLDDARATAERMARRSPESIRALKRAVYDGGSRPLREGLHIERAGFISNLSSEPAVRAMQAYVDFYRSTMDEPAPWADEELLGPWQDARVVDLTPAP